MLKWLTNHILNFSRLATAWGWYSFIRWIMNQIGQQFRLSIFGESHGPKVGVSIDSIPPELLLDVDDFSNDLQRRRTGGTGTSTRLESDQPEIISGHFNGFTTGPSDNNFYKWKSKSTDYSFVKNSLTRHADFVADRKYRGFEDYRGGGHFFRTPYFMSCSLGSNCKKFYPPVISQPR